MKELYVIVGLGNPGSKYENTRHNVGFDTIDLVSAQYDIKVSKIKHKALIGEGIIQGEKVILVKPQTYMNLSGESVREIIDWYNTPLHNVIVIYDDIDLDVGRVRVRPKGSAGTHNGMRSLLFHLKNEEFPRVRIGIGRPPEGWSLVNFVVGKFGDDERKNINSAVENAAEAVVAIIKAGVNTAMNKYNR